MSIFKVISGVEGCCLVLDDTRIAGPKPWGGGTVIHSWETDNEYKAVDTKSRWHELFGTPEKAAQTLESMSLDSSNWCRYDAEGQLACKVCPYEFDDYGCSDQMPLLEWLRGEDV